MSQSTFKHLLDERPFVVTMLIAAAVTVFAIVLLTVAGLVTKCPDGCVKVTEKHVNGCVPYEEWKNHANH